MKKQPNHWSKDELKIYVLLLCARADSHETEEELNLIKSKIDSETFNRLYEEFCEDEEDDCLEKIQHALEQHEYSNMELGQLKKEVWELFHADKELGSKERNIARILDNVLY
ncbi:hypothetical protein ATE92_1254 [Ulvibacter sp. MAR_2010_11]|uniref:hypothetical protein n=1 Tax=Ulvibacter sp. MAR_2010_11 TaxID=1250229 RepID=UPI000C2C3801|nr:hypothetical protein [Ulvibacter sp. MAR_2010_11]PKA83108.1 hypothetical protein ATE92_1254 [Ulvibacter sp. MAR_2010_11]